MRSALSSVVAREARRCARSSVIGACVTSAFAAVARVGARTVVRPRLAVDPAATKERDAVASAKRPSARVLDVAQALGLLAAARRIVIERGAWRARSAVDASVQVCVGPGVACAVRRCVDERSVGDVRTRVRCSRGLVDRARGEKECTARREGTEKGYRSHATARSTSRAIVRRRAIASMVNGQPRSQRHSRQEAAQRGRARRPRDAHAPARNRTLARSHPRKGMKRVVRARCARREANRRTARFGFSARG
jgi:hypothetical protein